MPGFENTDREASRKIESSVEQSENAREAGMNSVDLLKEKQNQKTSNPNDKGLPGLTLTDSQQKVAEEKPEQAAAARVQKAEEKKQDDPKEKNTEEKPKSKNEKIVNELKHFGQGLASGIFLKPVNGITQILNHVFHTKIPEIRFKDQSEVDKSVAGKIGSIAGDALLTVGTGGAAKAIGLGKAGLAATGAVREGVLSPTDESKQDSSVEFWKDRLAKAAAGAGKNGASAKPISLA